MTIARLKKFLFGKMINENEITEKINFSQFRLAIVFSQRKNTTKKIRTKKTEEIVKLKLCASLSITKMTISKFDFYSKKTTNEEQKSEEEIIEEKLIYEMKLPESKSFRTFFVTQIFKNLSSLETLKCSLVCKEWLSLARSDSIWRNHLVRDFVDMIPSKYLDKSHDKERDYQAKVKFLKQNKIKEQSPYFIVYWKLVDKLDTISYYSDSESDSESSD